ncbi:MULTISPECIES: ZIP family metal transporter [Streptomyces]|uniref:Zinc transporter ZupT n=2 Tax=Streptomyces TaxID=1883 RepID=A0A1D8FVP9_9ACTN|nr:MULTISPECIES: ZIP family zinc transporter [Streptomyces]AOT57263.1 zinc transporter ZupT [Streptomyces rubrolavendulae]OSY49603.1 zinc transporter ZupT [Streptomyces fradiae ATCC 10745 = DSM 40063]
MIDSLAAAGWGLLAGSALLVGAAVGYAVRVPRWLTASVMAFGSGVLISAVSFELVQRAYEQGGLAAAAIGTVAGALAYTGGNVLLARHGARHRKRSGHPRGQPSETQVAGSGAALALGALLDGVPESAAIGVSLLDGGAVSSVTVAAVFLSNLPEGLSSAAGMRRAGRGAGFVFGLWAAIAATSGISALLGFAVLGAMPATVVAAVTGVAAGAVLAMIADTMIPEAFEDAHLAIGVITVCGFLTSFVLSHA